jgi:mRNA-degrading endonuclease toxin of MazEF toxin-antitoxin module
MPCPLVPNNPTVSNHIYKGSIHWFDYNSNYDNISSRKARPYIIVSRTNKNSSKIIISPIQDIENYKEDGKLKYPFHAALYVDDYPFLDKDSAVLLDQIYTIPKEEFWEEWYMGSIDKFIDIDIALCYSFDLFESINEITNRLVSEMESVHIKRYTRR